MRALLMAFLVSACSAVVPGTAARLAAIDPLHLDPGALEMAVVFPAGLRAEPGSARIEVVAAQGDTRLERRFSPAEQVAAAPPEAATGSATVIYRLTRVDAALMRDWQAEVAALPRGTTGQARFGLGISGCVEGGGPGPDATGSVLIRTDPATAFQPLILNARLDALLGPQARAALAPCPVSGSPTNPRPGVEVAAPR